MTGGRDFYMGTESWVAVISLLVVIISHLCGTVWWMSKINTTLGYLEKNVSGILTTLAAHDSTYAKKEDVIERLAIQDNRIVTIGNKLDSLRDEYLRNSNNSGNPGHNGHI